MRSIAYDMRGFFQQVVEKYLQFFGKKETDLKSVQTPSIDDHKIPPEDFESKGALSNDAARIVMKASMAHVLSSTIYFGRFAIWLVVFLAGQQQMIDGFAA